MLLHDPQVATPNSRELQHGFVEDDWGLGIMIRV